MVNQSVGLVLLLLSVGVCAQTPDVSIVTDLRTVISESGFKPRLRLVDPLARHSTLTLQTVLENGIVARVSQRFARIPNDRAASLLETATLEAPGLWQIGQIQLPFGRQNLVRDYGAGGRLTTVLLIDALPVELGWVDSGDERVQGVVVRIGSRIGVSIASGAHFAATGTSLAMLRDPETAPGLGRGYRNILGADASTTVGGLTWSAEAISLRRGHTTMDEREDYVDLSVTRGDPKDLDWITVGYSRGLLQRTDSFRIDFSSSIHPKVALTGLAKWTQRNRNLAAGIRVRF